MHFIGLSDGLGKERHVLSRHYEEDKDNSDSRVSGQNGKLVDTLGSVFD